MTQALKRRNESTARAGGNVVTLLVVVAAALALFYYGFPALTSRDLLWFSTTFDEQPRTITVIDRGQRTEISPDDPRFAGLVDAFNRTIESGYRAADSGVSEATWEQIDQNGLLVEATYAEPVRLHIRGGFEPTRRLMILIGGGNNLYISERLFRGNDSDTNPWSLPLVLTDTAPLRAALERQGYSVE